MAKSDNRLSPKNARPPVGVIFTKQGSSKDAARIKQGSSKDDFSKNHSFGPLATPICGGSLNQNTEIGENMSDVELNETINGYRGSIGKLVFKKYKGRTIVGRKVKSSKPPTEGQLAQRAEFTEAAAFATSVEANPALLAFYEPIAEQRDLTVRAVAMGDYLKKPVIKPLDLDNYKGHIGDLIKIRAIDNNGLADLDVIILDQDGIPLESGKAIEEGTRSGKWIYTATTQVALGTDIFIEVKGVDHAGNEIKKTENPTVGMDV
jgi:hypothetical protein